MKYVEPAFSNYELDVIDRMISILGQSGSWDFDDEPLDDLVEKIEDIRHLRGGCSREDCPVFDKYRVIEENQ